MLKVDRLHLRAAHMLQTKMAPSSAVLRQYVWAYGMTTGWVGSVPLVIPLPARPKQLLTFSFADPYCIHRVGSDHRDASPRVTGYPISMEGKAASCAHFSPVGDIAAAM